MCIYLLTVAVPLSYSNEFLSIILANSGNFLKILLTVTSVIALRIKKKIISLNISAISAFVTVMQCVFCEIQHLSNIKPKFNYIRFIKIKILFFKQHNYFMKIRTYH